MSISLCLGSAAGGQGTGMARLTASRPVARVAGLIAVGLAAAACGGSSAGGSGSSATSAPPAHDNGEAAKPAAQILRDARQAALAARSVHVAGAITSGSGRIALDVSLLGSRGGRGRLAIDGLGFQVIRIGQTAYFSGTEAFYQRMANAAAAQLLKGRWLKASVASGSQFASFAQLTDMRQLMTAVLSTEGTPTKAGTSTYKGRPVVALTDSSGGGTLYVAAQGPPYPVAIVDVTRHGTVTFDRWDAPVSLSPPAGAIDLSTLMGG
jgi:hypothetical protein